MRTTISREFGFDMGHMLPDHRGGCYRPHGHRYRLVVTVSGDVQEIVGNPERGMVLDFAMLKACVGKVVDEYDHRFAVCTDDSRFDAFMDACGGSEGGVLPFTLPPTVENLARWMSAGIISYLPSHVQLLHVDLWETPTCHARFTP